MAQLSLSLKTADIFPPNDLVLSSGELPTRILRYARKERHPLLGGMRVHAKWGIEHCTTLADFAAHSNQWCIINLYDVHKADQRNLMAGLPGNERRPLASYLAAIADKSLDASVACLGPR